MLRELERADELLRRVALVSRQERIYFALSQEPIFKLVAARKSTLLCPQIRSFRDHRLARLFGDCDAGCCAR